MLTQIDVVYGDELGEQALALPILGVTPTDSLIIRKVTGLNPPDADLFIGDYARDGGNYQGRRIGNRNVVMTIDLNPNPALGESVEGLRDLLYKIFMDPTVEADHLELVLRSDDGRVRNLYGYTEKFETDLFDVETLAQVSLMCPDPYIRDVVETNLTTEFGTSASQDFVYLGTARTGFQAEVHVSLDTPGLTLELNNRTMYVAHDFLQGDVVHFNTMPGENDVTYVRNGVTYPLIAKLSLASRWLMLHSRNNTIKVYGVYSLDTVAGVKTLKYRASYWGV